MLIHGEIGLQPVFLQAHVMSQFTYGQQIIGLEKCHTVFEGQAFAGQYLFLYFFKIKISQSTTPSCITLKSKNLRVCYS